MQSISPSLMSINAKPPIVFVRGLGSWLFDQDDRPYLDFVQGWAVNCLGHAPAAVINTLARQAGLLIHCSPAFHNEPANRLATMLARHSGLDQVFFTNSGAEANEGAIKLARKWGQLHANGAYEIVTTHNGFHGRTLATMSASGKPQWESLFEPKVPGFVKVPYNDLNAVEQAITEKTVAVMLEPIQGEGGVVTASHEYLRGLRLLTKQRGILLILDEVQTGMGRTGKLFGHEHAGIRPDIMTLGKGIGAGVPLAALLASKEVSCFEYGDQGGTFNGNPLMTAVGCTVMETMLEPGFLDQVQHKGAYLRDQLNKLAQEFGLGEIRGEGLLLALELQAEIGAGLVDSAMKNGLLLNAPRPHLLRFMPALTVSFEEIDLMLDKLRGTLKNI